MEWKTKMHNMQPFGRPSFWCTWTSKTTGRWLT